MATGRRGRPRGRELSEIELRHLRLLLELRDNLQELSRRQQEQLEDFVLEMRDQDASVRGLADQLGVSPKNIRTWTENARRRRDTLPS